MASGSDFGLQSKNLSNCVGGHRKRTMHCFVLRRRLAASSIALAAPSISPVRPIPRTSAPSTHPLPASRSPRRRADTALRLARYFWTMPQLWFNLQKRESGEKGTVTISNSNFLTGPLGPQFLGSPGDPLNGHPPKLRQVEAIEIHHLDPCAHEVLHECSLPIVTSVDFRYGAKLGV